MKHLLSIALFGWLVFVLSGAVYAQEIKTSPTPTPQKSYSPKKLNREPETPQEFYEAALWEEQKQRKPENAIKILDRALSIYSDFTDGYLYRALINQEMGECQKAIADFDIVIAQSLTAKNTYVYRAECKIRLKDLQGALLDYDTVISKFAAEDKIQYLSSFGRGKLNYMLGKYESAIEDFDNSLRAYNQPEGFLFRGLTKLKKGDHEGAAADFKAIIDFWNKVSVSNGRNPEALVEKIEYPFDENPLATLKKKPKNNKKENKAEDTIVFVTKSRSKNFGDDKWLTLAEKFNPDNYFFSHKKTDSLSEKAIAHYYYGLTLERKGETAAAIKSYTQAIIDESYDIGTVRRRRARLQMQSGEYEPAVRDLSWTISDDGDFADDYLERGIAILMLGHDELAKKDFDKFLSLKADAQNELNERVTAAKKLRLQNKNVR